MVSSSISKLISVLSAIISFLIAFISSWNDIPYGILQYTQFIHGLFCSLGFVSPIALSLYIRQYDWALRNSHTARSRPGIISSLCSEMLVSLCLEYMCVIIGSSSELISVTSWVVSCNPFYREPQVVPEVTTNVVIPKFSIRKLNAILTTDLILFEEPVSQKTTPKSISEHEWQYIDLHGTVQGPFSREQMSSWYKAGFLRDDLRVSPGDTYTFRPIRDVFKNTSVPFD